MLEVPAFCSSLVCFNTSTVQAVIHNGLHLLMHHHLPGHWKVFFAICFCIGPSESLKLTKTAVLKMQMHCSEYVYWLLCACKMCTGQLYIYCVNESHSFPVNCYHFLQQLKQKRGRLSVFSLLVSPSMYASSHSLNDTIPPPEGEHEARCRCLYAPR